MVPSRCLGATIGTKAIPMAESTVPWQYRIFLSAVAATSLSVSGILIRSGFAMIGGVAAAFGASRRGFRRRCRPEPMSAGLAPRCTAT